jgi:thioredoxin-dependent peroxiredoxin
MKLKINDLTPDFKAKDQNGNEISSKNLMGSKWVLYFYPKDMTPGCTQQACNIRDNYNELKNESISIFGVSMDTESKHQRFIEKYSLPFPLIVDTEKELISAFGVWGPKKFLGKTYDGIHRTTFVFNEKNTLIGVIEKPKVKDHTREILEIYKNYEKK